MRKGRFAGLNTADPTASGLHRQDGLAPAALVLAAPVLPVVVALFSGQTVAVAGAGVLAALVASLGLWRLQSSATERAAAAGKVGERAEVLLAGFEESGCGWLWETNADGLVTYLSASLAAALERDRETLIGRRFEELMLVEDSGGVLGARPTLGFHLSSRFPFSDALVAPKGREDLCWSLSGRPRFDEVGRFLGFRGVGLNLSESQRDEKAAHHLAGCDSLTGLANRARMRAMLDEALANSASRREGCALLLIDLDRFKQVNDTLGHPIGDLLLKEVAQRLSAVVDSDGQVSRLGGDEFEVLLPGMDEEGRLAELADRIITQLSAPYVVRGHTLTIGASIGLSISRPGKTLAEALIKEADLALYAAKGAGRGTYRFFEPTMDAQESERRILENDLRMAIQKGQLRLVFQPIVSAATEDLVGFEALLRWSHPIRGLLPPADFLRLAEATGLITNIGEWVVREACSEAAKWPDHLQLSVNLSMPELEHPQLASIVAGALAASGLDPERLELDIGEPALLADTETIRSVLAALKTLGVRLALDDFGNGGASLHSLRSAALDRVKIHPSLVRAALPKGGRAQAALDAVVGLAERVGMRVTAEGAETIEELELIRTLGCTEIQGYLFGRPMTAEDAVKLAADSKPVSATPDFQPRPPRHSLFRRGTLRWTGGILPVRLRNISAEGAMIESGNEMAPDSEIEIDLSDGLRLVGKVRWSQDGRIGLKFDEAFDLRQLRGTRRPSSTALTPDYLSSELDPDSPWAARQERLSIKDVKRR